MSEFFNEPADLVPATEGAAHNGEPQFSAPGRKVKAGRGAGWLGEGWALFKQAPLRWIAAMLLLVVGSIVLQLIPVVGSIAVLFLTPFMMLGVLAFGHAIACGKGADLGQLWAGFQSKMVAPLLLLVVLYLVAFTVLMLVCMLLVMSLVGFAALNSFASPEQFAAIFMGAKGLALLLVFLLWVGGAALIGAAYWFAPGLIYFSGLGALAALKESFWACLRNWLPLLVFCLLVSLLAFVGALALMVGLLVVIPVFMAAYYSCFRGIFGHPESGR